MSARNRDHMANERTFLAWVRTCIGIMAFGFVIEKFSFFLKQIALLLGKGEITQKNELVPQRFAALFGICLVAIGTILCVLALLKYKKHERQIDRDLFQTSPILATSLTILLVVGGIFLITYLIIEV